MHHEKFNEVKGILAKTELKDLIEHLIQRSEYVDMELVQAEILQSALKKYRGNISKAARYLNMTRSALEYRLKKHAVI